MPFPLLAVVLGSALAGGGRVQHLVHRLVPEIEARAGRPFAQEPTAGIASRERLEIAMIRPLPQVRPPDLAPAEPSPAERARRLQRARHMLDHTMAVYLPGREGLYLVEDAIDEAVAELSLTPSLRRALVRCFVAHELVHALQHQYGALPPGPEAPEDLARGWTALLEGHATMIAADYCRDRYGEPVSQLKASIGGLFSAASHDPAQLPATYAWGEQLVRALHAEDPELVWAALQVSPPSWSGLAAATAGLRPPGARAPQALLDAAAALGGPVEVRESRITDPWAAFGGLLGRTPGIDTLPRSTAGWVVRVAAPPRHATLVALRFGDEATPATLPQLRQHGLDGADAQIGVLESTVSALRRSPSVRRWSALEERHGGVYAITVHAPAEPHPYRELWVATEHLLVVLAHSGPKVPPERELAAVSRALEALAAPAPGALREAPLRDWLHAVRARRDAGVVPQTSWQYRMHRAAYLLERDSSVPACTQAFHDVLAPGAVSNPGPYAKAAFECAAARHEVGLAAQALALLPEVEGAVGVYYAAQLALQGRYASALAVLGKVPADDPQAARARELLDELCPRLDSDDAAACRALRRR